MDKRTGKKKKKIGVKPEGQVGNIPPTQKAPVIVPKKNTTNK